MVVGVGENSEFGEVYKMMQSEEVCGHVTYMMTSYDVILGSEDTFTEEYGFPWQAVVFLFNMYYL